MVDKARTKVAFIMGKMDSGGKKTLAMQYFLNFDRESTEVHFICDGDSNAVPEEEIRHLGGYVHYVTPYQRILKNMADMHELFKQERFDVLHAFNSTMNIFPLYVAKRTAIPVRISESLSMANQKEAKTYLKLVLRRLSHRYATHFMACGEECGRWQFGDKAFDEGKVTVFKTAIDSRKNVYNPVLRQKTRRELGFNDDDLVVGFIGRFVAQKNPVFLMEVFKEILALEPSAKLLLVGDGDMKDEMFKVLDPTVESSISYLGRREDIVGFYQAMDCFLLPSLYEGLPVVGLEAQCAGCDVFFSDEVTREASYCELGHFLPLSYGASRWAKKIVDTCSAEHPRMSMADGCIAAGFDSHAEARRLEAYYAEALQTAGVC